MKDDFFEILRVLAEGGVDFAVVGGIAAKKAMGRPKDLLTVAQLEISGELEGD